MSTVGPIRPSQALRQRRESQRPSQLRSSTRIAHNEADSAASADKVVEKPFVMTEDYILKKFRGHPPSLIIHLHQHHFRFEHQDGNFPYNSPMKPLIQHLKDGTVPHFMLEEMLRAGVQFYDGCLIVQIVNHRSTDNKPPTGAQSNTKKKDNMIPGSIHNWNDHLTPSPFVPYPSPPKSNSPKIEKRPSSSGSQPSKEKKEVLQDIAKPGPKSPHISVTVLFPTQLSHAAEIEILATTPMPDLSSRRQARTAQTPISAHPPTPITSVPPTPSSGRPAKRQKMILDETNIHTFEAEVINATAPALYLDPVYSMAESVELIEATTHAMNKNPPPAPKTRKRTTAELAADEAQFNADQNFMLFGDSSAPVPGAGQMNGEGEGLRGAAATFEPRFSRFKTLENIKIQHEEAERLKKEEEARQAQVKREQQQAAEARVKEREAATQQAEHNRLMAQQEQQRQQHALQQEQMRRAQAAAAQASGNMMGSQQHPMQLSQPPQNSPMVRHQTPMQASPVINVNAVATHAMGGVPMAPTSSSQAGSPPRPPSAVPHSAGAQHMARQMSRQQSSQHPGSAHGTPQMVQGTPQMGQAVPVTRHMTPQPGRVNQHGSPMGMQGTPVMMNGTPQMPNGISHEQMARLQQMRRLQQQNAINNGSPQNMTQEQMQILRQQHMASVQAQNQMTQHHGQTPNLGGNQPNQYNLQLQQQMRNQMNQVAGATPNNVQQRPPNQGNPMMNNPAMANMTPAQQQEFRAKQQRERMIMKMVQHFGGAANVPPQIQHLIQQGGNQGIMRAWQIVMNQIQQQAQQQAQQNQGQQHNMNQPNGGGGPGMNMGGMGNMGQMNMGGMNVNAMSTAGGGQGGPQGNTAGMNGNMNMAQQLEIMRRMQFQQQQQAAQAVAHQQQAQQQAQNGGQGGGQGQGGPGTPDQQQAQQQYMARLIRQQQMLAQRNQAQVQAQQQAGQQGHPQQQMMGQMGGMGGMWQGGMGRPGQPGNGMG
ncbi:Spt20 family-domain-containing protein [Phyllosticta citriasiana]|uniref:Spt20 family-domain-containing protein n=1 Tax=Phyllosticta citriasiana TaxID=595635 RepID=A0ABR1KLV8_9PEZI